jgi:heme A synthase
MLLRLRMVHPAIAILGAAYFLWAAITAMQNGSPSSRTAGTRVLAITLLQVFVGAFNIGLLAPVWMQLIHLLMADALWIAVLLLMLESARVPRTVTTSVLAAVAAE